MSKTKAVDLIKAFQERIMAGGPLVTFGELESIRKELEEDEVTDADIAVLGVSSVVFSLVERIDDLEAWRRSIKQGKLTEMADFADGRTRLTIELYDSNGDRTSTTR